MLQLRRATVEDIPLLRDLAGRIWRACYQELISPAQIEFMLAWRFGAETIRHELEAGVIWELAASGAEPAGFLAWELDSAKSELKLHKLYLRPEFHGRGAWVDELYVREAWRGQGLGRASLAFAEELGRRAGIKALRLEVDRGNARAQRLYRAAGFQDHDRFLLTKWLEQG